MSLSPPLGIFLAVSSPGAVLIPAFKIFGILEPPVPFVKYLTDTLTLRAGTDFLIRMVFIRGKFLIAYFAYHSLE